MGKGKLGKVLSGVRNAVPCCNFDDSADFSNKTMFPPPNLLISHFN